MMESFDPYFGMRHALHQLSGDVNEWAGIPVPLEDERLVVEPKYKFAFMFRHKNEEQLTREIQRQRRALVRNEFWSTAKRSRVTIWNDDKGKVQWGLTPGIHHFDFDIGTIGASSAWGIAQERNALNLLATLVPHHIFKQYLLAGAFLETSERSGIIYCFRKLRPTVAIVNDKEQDELRILCCLCQHSIGYYAGTWGGAMCPTDDVIAHLMLMRADEPLFWRRSNQHAAWLPEAGL